MSKKAIVQLFKNQTSVEELRAVTNSREIIKIGRKNGLIFTKEEFETVKKAAVDLSNKNIQAEIFNLNKDCQRQKSSIYCYEFNLHDIQGLETLEKEIEKIKIQPDKTDLINFNKAFRIGDFNFASISPNSEEFQAQYSEIMTQSNGSIAKDLPESEYLVRRSFHLINLDSYIKDNVYDDYFQSKLKILRTLEKFFDANVKLTGSFCYPPNSYRTWHTNEDAAGWRMYFIDFDQPELSTNNKSFFRYMHPKTKKLVTLVDKPKLVRFFKIEQEQDKLFWHCIVNATQAYRWSFGFRVPDNWMEKIKLNSL